MRIAPVSPTARLADFGHKREQHEVCHDCGRPKTYTPRLGYTPLIRCITPGCAQTTFKPIPRDATTWTARGFI